jgi:uncharacterized membrane protein
MRFQPTRIRQSLQTSLWVVPVAAMLVAVLLAEGLLLLDQRIPQEREAWYLFGGQPDSAREMLSTIASALMQFTGLVFSITILVLQLASQQFSPRVLRTFLEDRYTRFSMGMFVGAFVYALALLPQVREERPDRPAFVPALSIFVAFVLVLVCVGVFVRYIHHMAQSIRAVHIIRRVADETRQSIEALYPEGVLEEGPPAPALPDGPPDQVFPHDRPAGVVTAVDAEALMRLACERDVLIALVPEVGDFLPRGVPLFRVWGQGRLTLEELRDEVVVALERTPHQDPAFGFRQLVDVAERALSPGINDPTTAVQALDQLHDLLRTLARRPLPSPVRADAQGRPRLVLPRPDWGSYVRLALDEVRGYGESSLPVARRIRELLEDLLAVAPPSRRAPLEHQRALLLEAIARGFHTRSERRLARTPSRKGQGEVEAGGDAAAAGHDA